MSKWNIDYDLDCILKATEDIWLALKGSSIFITGGTGFIGCWILESLRYANDKLDLDIRATILTRDARAFQDKVPHLSEYPFFEFVEGNVCDFVFPLGEFNYVIHAATDASAHLNETNPTQMFSTVIEGTRRILDFAVEKKTEKVLFLSSGAVYGQQPWGMTHVSESWLGGPNCVDPRLTYAEAKRAAEMLCAIYQKQFGLHVAIARIFALLGPYISLGIHFAAGNFIRDAIDGKKVTVKGNGMPCRSYLYASDLTTWLWHILVRGESGKPYNVGSSESISVKELAQKTASLLTTGEYEILGASDIGWNLGRYVPDTSRIRNDLRVKQMVSLDDAIIRTALWNGWQRKCP